MSLFERVKNKRYDLQEKKKFDPSELIKAIQRRSDLDAAKDFQKDVGKDITPELKGDLKTYQQPLGGEFAKGKKERKKRSDSGQTRGKRNVKGSDNPDQTDIFNQNKTKENKFKTRTDKALSNRDEFIKARKTYTDSKTGIGPGKPTEKGIIDYIAKARDKRQGTNANTKANRRAAEIIAQSSGSEYSDKIKNKYETDKSMVRKRRSDAASYDQIKAKIDKENPVIKGKTGGNIPDTPKNRRSMIPSDGGKEGQARIEKELELNKKTNTNKPKNNIPPTDKNEIGRRRTAQDNLRRNVYRDLDPDGGELQGKPTTDTSTKNRLNKNQSFINRTKQNRELQRQSRRNQRTTTTNVRKNQGLSDFEKGQIEFDRVLDKSKNKRQIVVNPNKTQQNRETQKLFRQTNRNRTVSDVRTSPKTEVIRKPKVERDIKSFIDKTKQKRELQRQSRLNQRTRTASDVRKNPGLSNYDKAQLEFDKNLEKIKKKIKVDKSSTSGIFDFSGELKRRQAQQKIKFDKFMTKIKGFKTPKVKPVKTGRFARIPKLISKTKAIPKPIRVAALALGTAGAIVGANQLTNTKQKNKDVKPKVVPFTTARKDLVPVTSKLYLGSGNKGGFYKPVKSGLATEKLPNIASAKK